MRVFKVGIHSNISGKFLLSLILVLGLFLRLFAINQSLWLDEAISALVVKNYSFFGIFDFVKSDFHPPLYYLSLKIWTLFFGYSEAALRFLSVCFGVGTVLATILIAKKLAKQKPFLWIVAGFLLATSPLHIYYSQEARMYSMAAFFATMSVYFYLKITEKGSLFDWLAFSFSMTLLVLTDYVPVFLLPIFWVYPIFNRRKIGWWSKFFLSHLPILIVGFFWLPNLVAQKEGGIWLLSNVSGWKDIAGGASLKQLALVWIKFVLGRISLASKPLYYSLVSLFSIPFLLSFLFFNPEKENKIVAFWFFIPLILAFIFSFQIPIFNYFRFIFVLPAFYLIVSFGILQLKANKLRPFVLSTIILANIVGILFYFFDKHQQREMWREAVGFVETVVRPGEIVILDYPEPFAAYRWYAKNFSIVFPVANSVHVDPTITAQKTKNLIEDKKGLYYFEYLVDLTDPGRIVEETLRKNGFKIAKIYSDFVGIGQITYWVK